MLAVCTGNICRSPAVERALTSAFGPGAGLVVASAGTRAVVGHPVSAPMVPLLAAAGASADGFVARQLTGELIRDADLVLALTRAHRSAVVTAEPSAVRRTFTLRELARLLAHGEVPAAEPGATTAQRLAAAASWAAAHRSPHPDGPDADDIDDPYGGSDALYARVFTEIADAVAVVVRVAAGPANPGPAGG